MLTLVSGSGKPEEEVREEAGVVVKEEAVQRGRGEQMVEGEMKARMRTGVAVVGNLNFPNHEA